MVLNLAYHLNSMGCDTRIATLSLDTSKLPSHLKELDYILPEKQFAPPTMDSVGAAFTSTLGVFNSLVRLLRRCSDRFDLVSACNFPSYWATYFARTGKPVVWISSEVLGPYGQTKDVYDRSYFFRFALGWLRRLTSVLLMDVLNLSLHVPSLTAASLRRDMAGTPWLFIRA